MNAGTLGDATMPADISRSRNVLGGIVLAVLASTPTAARAQHASTPNSARG